ncbi:MAG: response regulator [Desulfobacteraceae bacterium]
MMNPKVLIVDDQPLVLGVVQEILSRGPYHVSSANSAEEALKMMDEDTMDVVISDERMPGMQGSEFLAIVRKRFPDTVRIILTGHASVETAIRAINEGEVYRLLTKPVSSQDLYKAIDDGLKNRAGGRPAEQCFSLLESLEKQAPGITRVKRDDNGVVIIDTDE